MSVRVEKNRRVTTVILDRPEKRNAIDRNTAKALADAFRAFDADEQSDVAVLWGAGGTFCAGYDLTSLAGTGEDAGLSETGDAPLGCTRMLLSKPVVAAVAGYAVAGGLELATWCDLRVVERSATFGVFCRRFGVPLIDGGTIRLTRQIGQSRALDMILTGRAVGADEALQFGLANRVVDDGSSRQAAETLAHDLLEFPQTCMRSDRLSLYEQWDSPVDDALRNEFRRGMRVIGSGETIEGAKRFASGEGRHGAL